MAARELHHRGAKSNAIAKLEVVGKREIKLTEDEYRSLMSRLAMQEDRLDRFAAAFGAVCELISESTGLTEEKVFQHIQSSSVTAERIARSS